MSLQKLQLVYISFWLFFSYGGKKYKSRNETSSSLTKYKHNTSDQTTPAKMTGSINSIRAATGLQLFSFKIVTFRMHNVATTADI